MSRFEQTGGFHQHGDRTSFEDLEAIPPYRQIVPLGEAASTFAPPEEPRRIYSAPIIETPPEYGQEVNTPKEAKRTSGRKDQRYPELITTPPLKTICEIIEEAEPDWPYLIERLAELPGNPDPSARHGPLAELHVNTVLTGAAEAIEGITMDPLEDQTSENFTFSRESDGKLYAQRKGGGKQYAEYDRVLEAPVPTLVEVKTTSPKWTSRLNSFLQPRHLRHVLTPLQDFYETNQFGLIVVTNPESIIPDAPAQNSFVDSGGLLVALNTSLSELKHYAREVRPARPRTVYSSYSLPASLPAYRSSQ